MTETDTGFVVLFRAFTRWEWYDDALTVKLFLHLILSVNWEDKNWRGQTIKRGQIITSYGNLAKATNMSTMKLRKRLKDLESTGEIIIKTTNKFTLLTVVKYNVYQDKDLKRTNKKQSNNKQTTTTKPLKQLKQEKKAFTPPIESEFLKYAVTCYATKEEYFLYKQNLLLKFKAWDESGWINGSNQKPIKNWKTTLLNTIPYIPKNKIR